MKLSPFRMERWQSTYENRVRYNLSESGVHPMSVSELLELAGEGAGPDLGSLRLAYGQSNGSDELRDRIAALYPGATEANVLVTTGGAEANFACFWHLMEPGESAAVMLPNYMQVPGLLENFRARALPFHLREELGWEPDLDELEGALDAGARFVLVTNPNNPTGQALGSGAMDRIVELADAHGAWILADEVYQGAEVEDGETPSFWGRGERVLVSNSLSKAYGLPGLRLGWVVGPADLIAELWGRTDYTTICPATLSDHLAVVALEPATRQRIRARTKDIIHRNLGALRDWLDERSDLFRYQPPDAGAICYVRYDAAVGSAEFAERLRVDHGVLVVPGDHFGMDHFLRIGFGPPREDLMEALDRIDTAFRCVV
ncbi:MAG TPA: aminotransferase class I/II-fold pyridoxal phosphate-dependent enzyme [Longimicrobiales bacterium]